MPRRNFGDGALRLISQTTSTGWFQASISPVQTITAQAVGPGTGTFIVEGSLDGANWTGVIAATTFPTGGRTVSSTSANLITNIRASFSVTGGSTEGSSLLIAGR